MNYYNENDPNAAQWLRNLIAKNLIPEGMVDDRSILDVTPNDLKGFIHCHFFAGIGGWPLALQFANFPPDREVWTGSCPCQPFSAAGQGRQFADERHLWPYWFHLIAQRRPATILGEQVASKPGLAWFDLVWTDLENAGYAVGVSDLGAACVGAPHIRQRLWFVGHAEGCDRRLPNGKERREDFEFAGTSEAHELADANGARQRAGRPGEACGGRDASRVESSGFCIAGELGDASSARLQERERNGRVQREALEPSSRQTPVGGSNFGIVGHATGDEQRQPRLAEAGERRSSAIGGSGPWRDLDWLPCTDGKARPTQSGLQPLAHGIPGRVGRLRAYGNAIVPQAAAAFVRAYLDCRP